MDQKVLHVEKRTQTGKNACRRLRVDGFVPGVVYGKGVDATPVTLAAKELGVVIASGRNALLTLNGGGLDGMVAIIADLTRDSIKGFLKHVDLHKVNMAEKLRLDVPVKLNGTALGVKEGGLLEFAMHTIEIECLPSHIPECIEVDVTELTIGHSIHIGDVTPPTGVKFLGEPKSSIVSILGKVKDETAAPAAEE